MDLKKGKDSDTEWEDWKMGGSESVEQADHGSDARNWRNEETKEIRDGGDGKTPGSTQGPVCRLISSQFLIRRLLIHPKWFIGMAHCDTFCSACNFVAC